MDTSIQLCLRTNWSCCRLIVASLFFSFWLSPTALLISLRSLREHLRQYFFAILAGTACRRPPQWQRWFQDEERSAVWSCRGEFQREQDGFPSRCLCLGGGVCRTLSCECFVVDRWVPWHSRQRYAAQEPSAGAKKLNKIKKCTARPTVKKNWLVNPIRQVFQCGLMINNISQKVREVSLQPLNH